MSGNTRGWYLLRIVYLIILIIAMAVYFAFRGLYVLFGLGDLFFVQWFFLTVSILISMLAFINYYIARKFDSDLWKQYTLWLLIAMLFGTLGDFLLAGVLPIAMDTFIFGVLAFTFGQVFYLIALRQLSPLIFNTVSSTEPAVKSRIVLRNLVIWVVFIIGCAAGYMLFLFDPAILELSIGGLIYFLLFSSVLAFALTKLFDRYPLPLTGSLFVGFLLFYISDLVLVYNRFKTPILFAGLIISITYLLGQLLVQLTPILKANNSQ